MIDPYPARKLLRLLGAVVLSAAAAGRGAIGPGARERRIGSLRRHTPSGFDLFRNLRFTGG
jgi:hypothetical protein